ncbi:MAG: hypothetical protein KIT18_17350 [Burkholderiales bacterium]|nr:hypothetical protein [Burkholderiales bacterium]
MESLRRHHPDLPVHVVRSQRQPTQRSGDGIDWHLLSEKARVFELSPFAETLFLDIDTVVLGDLSFGFRQAQRFGLACSICEAPLANRFTGLRGAGEIVEYNTGVLFFSQAAEPVFRRWVELAATLDSSLLFVGANGGLGRMPFNDQASFAKAIHDLGFNPFILPQNWNFRFDYSQTFFGPLKIWHSYADVPADLNRLQAYYRQPDHILQFHSSEVAPAG